MSATLLKPAAARNEIPEPTEVAQLGQLEEMVRTFTDRALDRDVLTDLDYEAMDTIARAGDRAASTAAEAWRDHLRRADPHLVNPNPPSIINTLHGSVHRFLDRSREMATFGSVVVPVISVPQGRAAVVKEGETLLGQIGACIEIARDRAAKDFAWYRKRYDFIDELYTRPETASLMLSYDELEARTGEHFDKPPHNTHAMKRALINTLDAVLSWCSYARKPFIFEGLPQDEQWKVNDWLTMREEWKRAERDEGA